MPLTYCMQRRGPTPPGAAAIRRVAGTTNIALTARFAASSANLALQVSRQGNLFVIDRAAHEATSGLLYLYVSA